MKFWKMNGAGNSFVISTTGREASGYSPNR